MILPQVLIELAEVELSRGFFDDALNEVNKALEILTSTYKINHQVHQTAIFLHERILHDAQGSMEKTFQSSR